MFVEHSQGEEHKKILIHPFNLSPVPNSGNIGGDYGRYSRVKFFAMSSAFFVASEPPILYQEPLLLIPLGHLNKRKKKQIN